MGDIDPTNRSNSKKVYSMLNFEVPTFLTGRGEGFTNGRLALQHRGTSP